jgi:hypothetical protein
MDEVRTVGAHGSPKRRGLGQRPILLTKAGVARWVAGMARLSYAKTDHHLYSNISVSPSQDIYKPSG